MNTQSPFKWRHFQADIILMCVRWYLRYPLSYRDLEEMTRERGLRIDHTTIYRWVQHSAPELEKRCRSHLKACNDLWKVDETYFKVKKVWMYHSRSVDSEGNTLEFLLSATRDAEAAKHFFIKALGASARSVPQATTIEKKTTQPPAPTAFKARNAAPHVINVDKNQPIPKPLSSSKPAASFPHWLSSGKSNT
jgi:transposase, IS6 family